MHSLHSFSSARQFNAFPFNTFPLQCMANQFRRTAKHLVAFPSHRAVLCNSILCNSIALLIHAFPLPGCSMQFLCNESLLLRKAVHVQAVAMLAGSYRCRCRASQSAAKPLPFGACLSYAIPLPCDSFRFLCHSIVCFAFACKRHAFLRLRFTGFSPLCRRLPSSFVALRHT